jgi:hypothetical protein
MKNIRKTKELIKKVQEDKILKFKEVKKVIEELKNIEDNKDLSQESIIL